MSASGAGGRGGGEGGGGGGVTSNTSTCIQAFTVTNMVAITDDYPKISAHV